MVKRMLIDATHPEETRVVVVNGTRLEELDVETSTKKQIKGNIYLAKVVRVEPSLQAAFVEYGGNRHGFLAFSEIHPDYFQIPVADRQALLAESAESLKDHGDRDMVDVTPAEPAIEPAPSDDAAVEPYSAHLVPSGTIDPEVAETKADIEAEPPAQIAALEQAAERLAESPDSREASIADGEISESGSDGENENAEDGLDDETENADDADGVDDESENADGVDDESENADGVPAQSAAQGEIDDTVDGEPAVVETVGGDDTDDDERRRPRNLRNYKIQEVIKRRQIILVQVVKEERGNKGAALTTYLSLAGRYCVLMPNTARGGGVSRKITSITDRRRLKSITSELDIPDGMAVIVRTAGSERSKPEIKRDYEYLIRAWDSVRQLTLDSAAPALVYEEASLIKRSIRDLYAQDIDEVLVDGEEGYRLAKDYMRMLTPSHAKKVQPYRDPTMPLFHRFQVDSQLDAMHSPVVQLRSGGYIVISPTEALVAIDVNSGRATKERHIEETAYKTNAEAAEEIARQLRLRDLAGLIVIDFIDMEDSRNNHSVERRLKDAMKGDRARIQLGRISPFGLLELSRQRLRPSLQETSFEPCSHCAGTGIVRSVESTAVYILRAIEEEGIRRRSSEVTVTVSSPVALYILNQKRTALAEIEARYDFRVLLLGDDTLIPPAFRMDRVKAENRPDELPAPQRAISLDQTMSIDDEDDGAEETEEEIVEAAVVSEAGEAETDAESESNRKRRKRRKRRRRGPGDQAGTSANGEAGDGSEEGEEESDEAGDEDKAENAESEGAESEGAESESPESEGGDAESGDEDKARNKRRRGKRGGRRRNRGREEGEGQEGETSDIGDVSEPPEGTAPGLAAMESAAEPVVSETAIAETGEAPALESTLETVAEDEPKKPVRRRAPRKTAAQKAAEAETDGGENGQEDGIEAPVPVKPKRSRAKPKAEAADAGDAGDETEGGEKKPVRRRAPRKTAAQKAAEAQAAEAPDTAPSQPESDAEPAPAEAASPPQSQPEPAPEASQPEPQTEPAQPESAQTEETGGEDTSGEDGEAKPQRRGWWNRMLS